MTIFVIRNCYPHGTIPWHFRSMSNNKKCMWSWDAPTIRLQYNLLKAYVPEPNTTIIELPIYI